MPNGHVVSFLVGTTSAQIAKGTEDYVSVLRSLLVDERRHRLFIASVAWLVPCLLVYAAGATVAWVRRGFRLSKT